MKKKSAPRINKRPTRSQAEDAVRTLIRWVGEDEKREGLVDTPRRVVKAFEEYFEGYQTNVKTILSRSFEEVGGYTSPVLIRDIDFESRCEHHLAPFIGVAHIAYIPNNRVVGLSKIARLVDAYARRMQVQERLTVEIADAIQKHLKAKGVAVMLEAEHFCMKVRGVKKSGAMTVTTQFLGAYAEDDDMREEFLMQVKN